MKRIFEQEIAPVLAIVALAASVSSGCAFSARTVGMHDPTIDVVQSLAATQTATIKALTDALTVAQRGACPVPEVVR